MIWLLDQVEHKRMAPWKKDGQFDDAIFRVVAKISMEGMGVGIPRQGFPFDVDELFRRLRNEKPGPSKWSAVPKRRPLYAHCSGPPRESMNGFVAEGYPEVT